MIRKNYFLKMKILEQFGTQKKFAESLGMHWSRLSGIVCGYVIPTDDEVRRIAEALSIPEKKVDAFAIQH